MGMDAELLAVGPFSREVVDALEYPPDYYDAVPEGATIVTRVANCNTTDGSVNLATALGVGVWRFGQHCGIKPDLAKVDLELFAESVEDGVASVADFLKLGANGFTFYYLPNG